MRTLTLATLAVLATACPGGSGGGSIPMDQYYTEMSRASCARYLRCGVVHSEAGCTAWTEALSSFINIGVNGVYDDLTASGKVKYDGARARRCLDSYASVPCSSSYFDSDDCRGIFEGQVAVGGACSFSFDCVPAAYCTYGTGSTTATCPGTCKARVGEGGTASSAAECVVPLVLVDGKCAKAHQAGESCTSSECASGLLCIDKLCRALGDVGAACSSVLACSQTSYLSCESGTCRALPDVGESCSPGGLFNSCKTDLHCDASSKCQEGLEGQACDATKRCGLGLACDQTSKTCKLGQSCGNVNCGGNSYCETGTQVCKPRISTGQPCTQTGSCANLGTCSKGVCKSMFSCP